MAAIEKKNVTKVNATWRARIEKENAVNISNDRQFRVARRPSTMAEKVNLVDPRKMVNKKEGQKVNFQHPPVEEVGDLEYFAIETIPKERFPMTQRESHNFGWLEPITSTHSAFASYFLNERVPCFTTGMVNMRDSYFQKVERQQAQKKKNPMAHHPGWVTHLGDNPRTRVLKPVHEWGLENQKDPEGLELLHLWEKAMGKKRKRPVAKGNNVLNGEGEADEPAEEAERQAACSRDRDGNHPLKQAIRLCKSEADLDRPLIKADLGPQLDEAEIEGKTEAQIQALIEKKKRETARNTAEYSPVKGLFSLKRRKNGAPSRNGAGLSLESGNGTVRGLVTVKILYPNHLG